LARAIVGLPSAPEDIAPIRNALLTTLLSASAADAIADWITTAFPRGKQLTPQLMAEGFRILAKCREKPQLFPALDGNIRFIVARISESTGKRTSARCGAGHSRSARRGRNSPGGDSLRK
jgi:hypothetical protein